MMAYRTSTKFLDGTNPISIASLRPRLVAYSDAGGSVTVTPMKLNYELGELVTLTAIPFATSVFVGWTEGLDTGDLVSTTNPASLCDKWKQDRAGTVRLCCAVPARFGVLVEGRERCAGCHGTKRWNAASRDFIWRGQSWTGIRLRWGCCGQSVSFRNTQCRCRQWLHDWSYGLSQQMQSSPIHS